MGLFAGSAGSVVPAKAGDALADSPPAPAAAPRRPPAPHRRAGALPLPGEFEPQSALMLGCNELIPLYPDVFTDVVAAAHKTTTIVGLVCDDRQVRMGLDLLAKRGLPPEAVRFVRLPLDSMWVRDYGPLFVPHKDGSVSVAEGRYVQEDDIRGKRPQDDEVARLLGELLRLPVVSVPLQFEGGNLLSNGRGLCVTTVVLIAENLQRGCRRAEIGSILAKHFGFTSWVYVRRLIGEPTGHVDMFMTFLAPDVAVVGRYDPAVDPANARVLDETAAILSGLKTARGRVKVHRVPMPPRRGEFWRTYTNVIFANGTLLMPTFKDVDPALQNEALALYARLLPGWKVVGINADSLEPGRGLLHCFSMHVPRYVSLRGRRPGDDHAEVRWYTNAAVPLRRRAAMGPAAVHLDRLGS